MPGLCVIFDLDGTLVDSERQSNQAFLDLLPELGEPVDALVRRYRGMRLLPVLADIEARLGRKLAEDFTPRYRQWPSCSTSTWNRCPARCSCCRA
jgi:beta-phosphoglucomutase-like phosphatase (HAD superfamily)